MKKEMAILGLLYETCIKPKISAEEIAKKHGVDLDRVKKELKRGTLVEMEHTKEKSAAEAIASHHLDEMIDYYEKLSQIEEGTSSGSVKLFNSIVRLPMKKPYGFWMDKHGNFAIAEGMGGHERVGSLLLDDMGMENRDKGVYDTLFELGWMRIVTALGKTYYELGIGQRMTNIQKRNIEFINDFYDLGGVQEG